MNSLCATAFQNIKFLALPKNHNFVSLRNASKKASSSTKNSPNKGKPKHRGWKVQDGHNVIQGTILATQRTTRFHPGLNVIFGRNGTLCAMEDGKVMVTCEKINPNWEHTWIDNNYKERQGQLIFKKHYNVIPEPQHDRFIVIDRI